MMVSSQKRKGTAWEVEAVKRLNEYAGRWKRTPLSGAMGTILEEPSLTGDVRGDTKKFLGKDFVLEAKTGYGGAKQLAVKKIWFDKVSEEASVNLAFPGIICKFSNARSGVRHFVAFDLEVFGELLVKIKELSDELDKVYTELAKEDND